MRKVRTTAPPEKSKLVHTYETRSILAKVVRDPESNRKRLSPLHPAYYEHEINQIPEEETVSLIITNKKPKRTSPQNRYMHLYFTLIAIAHGHGVTMEDVKTWAKGKCLAQGITEVFGDKVRKVKETSKLTVNEMIEFVARVEVESNIPTPDPTPFKLGPSYAEFNRLKQEEITRYRSMKPANKIS
jgi:hypothetical protein